MKKTIILLLVVAICSGISSCRKVNIENRDKLLLGTWDCVDYADSASQNMRGRPPVFISHLYEKGYVFKRKNLMWTRNLSGDNEMYTDKRELCKWALSEDKQQVTLFFPTSTEGDIIETYEIVELTRKQLILKGKHGFWADNAYTYIFEKQ